MKAQNEVDRQQWLNALEYSRHRAIRKADSDEDEDTGVSSMSDVRSIFGHLNTNLDKSIADVHSLESQISKFFEKIFLFFDYLFLFTEKALNDVSKISGSKVDDKIQTLKQLIENLSKTAADTVNQAKKETNSLSKFINNENEQRLRLQEQIETLAKQHSKLERAAFISTSTEQPRMSFFACFVFLSFFLLCEKPHSLF